MFFICTGTVGTLIPATVRLCTSMLLVPHWYCRLYVLPFICTGTVGTVGTLVPATLCLCTNMLLVPHWYCCLYVQVLCVLLLHWCQPLYISVPIYYWYHTGTAVYMYWYCGNCWYIGTSHFMSLYQYVTGLYMYWYCGYCWYIGTSHSMSLYQYLTGTALVLLFIYTGTVGTVGTLVPVTLKSLSLCLYVTGTTLVLLFICTGTVGTVGTLVPATLFLCAKCYWYCTGTAVYMYWYCGYCSYIGTSHSRSLCLYVTGTTLVLLFICTGAVGTVGTLVPATLCLCTNMLLVLHWYCSLYVLVLWVLLVQWYQPLYVSVPIYYWYCTGTAVYMYWYCGYCWYICTSHFMSLYQYVTGTALVLLFICSSIVGTVGTLVPATLFLCTNMLLVLHWYCSLYGLVLWVLWVHLYQPLSVPIRYWYHTGTAFYMYWYCGYCWYTGTSHSMSLCLYVNGTTLVLLFICTGIVSTVGTLVPATLSLYQYVTGTALVLLFICTGTVGTVGKLVPATLCLCTNMLLVLHWYCCLYVLVLWVLLVHLYQSL